MVGCKVGLRSLRRELVTNPHDTGIVNHHVDGWNIIPGIHLGSCIAHTFQRTQINLDRTDLDIWVCGRDIVGDLLEFVGVTGGQDESGGFSFGDRLDEEAAQGTGRDAGRQNNLILNKMVVVVDQLVSSCVCVVWGWHDCDGDSDDGSFNRRLGEGRNLNKRQLSSGQYI